MFPKNSKLPATSVLTTIFLKQGKTAATSNQTLLDKKKIGKMRAKRLHTKKGCRATCRSNLFASDFLCNITGLGPQKRISVYWAG